MFGLRLSATHQLSKPEPGKDASARVFFRDFFGASPQSSAHRWTLNLRAEPLHKSLVEKWWQEPELNRRFNSAHFKVINTLILFIFVF
jgi:hypothetical protein